MRKIRKEKREHFERYSFLFCLEPDSADKHQHGMKEAQMMTSEEAPGLLDRIRIDGRMTTARASDDGGVTAVSFSFWCGRKENQNIFDWESRPTAGDCRFVSWEGSNKSNRGKEAK